MIALLMWFSHMIVVKFTVCDDGACELFAKD